MSGAAENPSQAPAGTGDGPPPPFAGSNGASPPPPVPIEPPPVPGKPRRGLPDPPPEMPKNLKRAWYSQQIRDLKAKVFERYFYMGLIGFGAISGVVLAALGVHSGEPGFYAGTAISPGVVGGGLWALRKLSSEEDK